MQWSCHRCVVLCLRLVRLRLNAVAPSRRTASLLVVRFKRRSIATSHRSIRTARIHVSTRTLARVRDVVAPVHAVHASRGAPDRDHRVTARTDHVSVIAAAAARRARVDMSLDDMMSHDHRPRVTLTAPTDARMMSRSSRTMGTTMRTSRTLRHRRHAISRPSSTAHATPQRTAAIHLVTPHPLLA